MYSSIVICLKCEILIINTWNEYIKQKLFSKYIEEIISGTSKCKKLSEELTLISEAFLNVFYVPWNVKTFSMKLNMVVFVLWSAPACICGTPKRPKFSSTHLFPILRPVVSSIGTSIFPTLIFPLYSSINFPVFWSSYTFSF